MKIVVNYLNCVFFIVAKIKTKYKILNFVFQFNKMARNGTLGTQIEYKCFTVFFINEIHSKTSIPLLKACF